MRQKVKKCDVCGRQEFNDSFITSAVLGDGKSVNGSSEISLEGQRENNERLLVNEKKRLLEAEHELETMQKELFDLENFSV